MASFVDVETEEYVPEPTMYRYHNKLWNIIDSLFIRPSIKRIGP